MKLKEGSSVSKRITLVIRQTLDTSEEGSMETDFIQTKGVAQRCTVKKVFLKISQNSQKNTMPQTEFQVYNFIKKETLV